MEDKLSYYRATILNVVDGDTYDVEIDLGLNGLKQTMRLRLLGCDTPEMKGPTASEGRRSRDEVVQLFAACEYQVIIHVVDHDNFGRCLADVYFHRSGNQWTSMADFLIENGLAKVYMASLNDIINGINGG